MNFGCNGPFPVHLVAVAAVEGAVIKAGLGVLLQLLGQVGAGRAGGNIFLVTILWIVQLFDKAHRPGKYMMRGWKLDRGTQHCPGEGEGNRVSLKKHGQTQRKGQAVGNVNASGLECGG